VFSSYPAETSIHPTAAASNKHHELDLLDEDDEDLDEDDDDDDDGTYAHGFFTHGGSMTDLHPEITKLNALNHFLSIDGLPQSDKLLLIYEKIL
jgi:hypothetical protein